MSDPRLNSIHLEAPRRQDYRRAREALLDSRGGQTLYAEINAAASDSLPSDTLIQNAAAPCAPAGLQCWLADDEFIYPLKTGLNTLGRSADNDVVVPECFISRRHCAILVHVSKGCDLHDTASKNGTFLNDARLDRPAALQTGDTIRIGESRFVFVARDEKRRDARVTAAS